MVPILLVVLSFVLTTPLAAEQQFAAAREQMVSELQAMAKTAQSREIDPAVLAAMREVPRHELVPEAVRHSAYANHPLPIGYEQSISQPYIVALMTTLAMPAKHHVV